MLPAGLGRKAHRTCGCCFWAITAIIIPPRFEQLQPVLQSRGIALTYTEDLKQLDPKTLARYDGLMIYANHPQISPDQERALLDYVAGGKGLVLLHCTRTAF